MGTRGIFCPDCRHALGSPQLHRSACNPCEPTRAQKGDGHDRIRTDASSATSAILGIVCYMPSYVFDTFSAILAYKYQTVRLHRPKYSHLKAVVNKDPSCASFYEAWTWTKAICMAVLRGDCSL